MFTRSAGTWTRKAKLLASDKSEYDYFGGSVAIDVDTALIDGGGAGGSAYVFTRAGDSWAEQAKLVPADNASRDGFGVSVSIDGDTALIGAHLENDSGTSNNGAAYVFTRSGETWTEQAKLLASDKADIDQLGFSVAIDGGTVIAGAFHRDENGLSNNGAAYVFDVSQLDDPPPGPVLSFEGSPTAVEGKFLQFLLTLSEAASDNVSFDIQSIDETAIAPDDYDPKAGSRLLAAGETQRSIRARTVDDDFVEGDETLQLTLSNLENASLGQASATGTIIDNDIDSEPVILNVSDARAAEGEYARFYVSLSEPSDTDVVFSVRTYNGTAYAGGDFAAKTGNRIIAAGETEKIIWIEAKTDDRNEGQEQFRLRVEARSDNALNGNIAATSTIDDR